MFLNYLCEQHKDIEKQPYFEKKGDNNLFDLAIQTKKPCGFFLDNMRGWGSRDKLDGVKKCLSDILSQDYTLSVIETLSGLYINQRGVSDHFLLEQGLTPNWQVAQEYFKLINEKDEARAFLVWNPNNDGKEENIIKLKNSLEALKFQRE